MSALAVGGVTPQATTNLDGISAIPALVAASAGSNGVDQINGADQANGPAHGIKIVVDITAITGTTPTLVVALQGKDPVSGKYFTMLATAALAAVATTVLTVYPGAAVSANASANDVLPRTWRVITTIAGTTPAVTATVGAILLP